MRKIISILIIICIAMTFKLPIAAVGNVSSDIAIDQKSAVIEQVEFVYPMDVVGSGSFQGTGVRTIPIGTISVTVRGDSATGYIYTAKYVGFLDAGMQLTMTVSGNGKTKTTIISNVTMAPKESFANVSISDIRPFSSILTSWSYGYIL